MTSLAGCPELLLLGVDWSKCRMLGLQPHGLHMTPVGKQGSWEETRMQATLTLFGTEQINISINQKLLQIGVIFFEKVLKMVLCIAT